MFFFNYFVSFYPDAWGNDPFWLIFLWNGLKPQTRWWCLMNHCFFLSLTFKWSLKTKQYPRCSKYGLFTYIWVLFLGVNVGRYTSPIWHLGMNKMNILRRSMHQSAVKPTPRGLFLELLVVDRCQQKQVPESYGSRVPRYSCFCFVTWYVRYAR